jgi:hypothetical protein
MKNIVFLLLLLLIGSIQGFTQTWDPDSLKITEIRASETDVNIDFELAKHYTFYNPTLQGSFRHVLIVYLPGSFDNPLNTLLFPSYAANNGFHAVSLKYENRVAAKSACGSSTDSLCFSKYRQEIVTGTDVSDEVDVDSTNSIENRLVKLLIYLDNNYPSEGWGQYIENGQPIWSKIIVAGHSQGGGHAAYMGLSKPLNRVLMFSSPNDWSEHFKTPAAWTAKPKTAPQTGYYAFGNLKDDVVAFRNQYEIWKSLGMLSSRDTARVDFDNPTYGGSWVFYTDTDKSGLSVNHNATVRDSDTPKDSLGKPLFEDVWGTMLGIHIVLNTPKAVSQNLKIYPNPATNYINIPIQWKNISLLNSAGNQVLLSSNLTQRLFVGDLQKGLYYIRLSNTSNIIYSRFIKE